MPVLILAILATVIMAFWLFLLFTVTDEDWILAATYQVLACQDKIDELKRKDASNAARLAQYHGVAAKVMSLFLGGDSHKEINKLQSQAEQLQNGELKSVSLLEMPGYVLQRRIVAIGRGSFNKTLYGLYSELKGSKYAGKYTAHLLAQILSYPILTLAAALALGAILLGFGNLVGGLAAAGVGSVMAFFLAYVLYDSVGDAVKKRRAAIARQFPNVVSKLALLVTSGMIMDRAWQETAESQNGELYWEMRKVVQERNNLVEPAAAYAHFIDRCATKEATKLASAIIQNQSKGNAEIGRLLKDMAHEAWQERRHTAKRDAEHANSKLMIPTMLLFVAILVMIMVPIALSFSTGF